MTSRFPFYRREFRSAARRSLLAGLAMATAVSLGQGVAADDSLQLAQNREQMIVVPDVDAIRGRHLFVMKGCVSCHSVAGVGGKAAPALDASEDSTTVNLLDFAARMWRGASAMQELQSIELGYQIELTGNEIGDIAAFASSPTAQEGFSIDEVPDLLKDWFIDEIYWDGGEWPETEEWQFPK